MAPKSHPRPDLADQIVEALSEAKSKAKLTSVPLTRVRAGQLVRTILLKALQPDSKAPSSPFGDRKAIPPTPEQVEAYSLELRHPINGAAFCDFYQSKGWLVGKTKMKDWQAAVRTWQSRNKSGSDTGSPTKDYTNL